jgi:6-pyruvoyltetrahydropterin/6-carboxytetrahydropterin synthase
MSHFLVTRRIGIDAGHRIRRHQSKCRHLHGHRYEIEASCRAATLHQDGEQSGMVLDFGFLKEEMLRVIDAPCDHGFIAEVEDADLLEMFAPSPDALADWLAGLATAVARDGFAATTDTRLGSRLYVIAAPPTAEALARHWFERLAPAVAERSDGLARLDRVRVWETPNCWAEWGL